MELNIRNIRKKKRKNFIALSEEGKRITKKEMIKRLSEFSAFCDLYGLNVESVKLIPKTNVENSLKTKIEVDLGVETNIENQSLQIKDTTHLSNRNYRKLRSALNLKIPSIYRLEMIKYASKIFDKSQHYFRNDFGFYVDPRHKLEKAIAFFLRKSEFKGDEIKVKFSGDGKMLTRTRIQLLNLTFTIINSDNCKTSSGNFQIGKNS